MHFKKQPSWACCPSRRWQHWGRTWSNSSGYIEPAVGLQNAQGILATVGRFLQAGGRSQDEDCWEIHSHREVCSKEGATLQFSHPGQTTCPCSGEKTRSHPFSSSGWAAPRSNICPPPPQEMMYIWNGFTVVGKRPSLTQNILATLEEADEQLRKHPSKISFKTFCPHIRLSAAVIIPTCYSTFRPHRVSPWRPVRDPAAEGSVSQAFGASGPGWALL